MNRKQMGDAGRIVMALGVKLCEHGKVAELCGICAEEAKARTKR